MGHSIFFVKFRGNFWKMKINAALFGLASAKTLTNDVNSKGITLENYNSLYPWYKKIIKLIQQSVLTIQIEMIFPVEISPKTSDGLLQLLLIKLKVVLMKERKEKIFGTFGLIKNIQITRPDVISTIVIMLMLLVIHTTKWIGIWTILFQWESKIIDFHFHGREFCQTEQAEVVWIKKALNIITSGLICCLQMILHPL